MSFTFHRQPLAHQLRDFNRFKDWPFFALFYEQRARKTKVALDIFRYRYEKGDVQALVVIAYPSGVHRVWIDELPKDFTPDFLKQTKYLAWRSGNMKNRQATNALDELMAHKGPKVLTLNCEAILTKTAHDYLIKFFAKHKTMLLADESSWMANWSARTKRMLRSYGIHRNVVIKSILDGTPVDEGPTDIYFPTTFLRRGSLGYTSKLAFNSRYVAYEMEEIVEESEQLVDGILQPVFTTTIQRAKHFNHRTEKEYEVETGVQNLEELNLKLDRIGSRVRRADVSDAPPKTYQTRYFKLTDKQRKTYDELRDNYIIQLNRGEITLSNVLTRMSRLQTVARNFYPPERHGVACIACSVTGFIDGEECPTCEGLSIIVTEGELERIDTRNPAAEALTEELRVTRGPAIIWCSMRQDVTDAMEAVQAAGRIPHRFDGSVSPADRADIYQAFKRREIDNIVATIQSGLSRGHDLTNADLLCYYSNVWSLRHRRQSEDRAESLDRKTSTDIVDLVAEDTRDLDNITALREKRLTAAAIMGDPPEKWI